MSVSVVIPVYSVRVPEIEMRALLNNIERVRGYSIYIICPEDLDITSILSKLQSTVSIVRFQPEYFQSLEGYNKLLRSSLFYSSFSKYEYILIMQLDTYIFGGSLEEFVSEGYDYWGAPWIGFELINYKFLRPVLPLLHKSRYLRRLRGFTKHQYLVGNGGLSLRKVATHLLVTEKFEKEIKAFESEYDKWIAGGATSMMEDVFWTLYVPKFYPQYKVAPWQEAISFSFETSPQEAYRLNGNKLPFGCHAFDKVANEFYKPFIPILSGKK